MAWMILNSPCLAKMPSHLLSRFLQDETLQRDLRWAKAEALRHGSTKQALNCKKEKETSIKMGQSSGCEAQAP